jgi:internalin A
LKFRICYNFLPKSVMPRFIVRSHKDIKDKLSWRTGVVLENKGFNATAVVKADQREKIINIFVDGTQKRDYFAAILHTFREINGSFEQIEVDECVPLPDKPKIAVNYLHLLRLERMGQAEFLPEKAEKSYIVEDLLDGIKPKNEWKKELEHLLRENKMVINVHPPAPVTTKESGKKKVLKTVLKIAAAIAALIAFLAALFALIDSQSFREFWQKLIR